MLPKAVFVFLLTVGLVPSSQAQSNELGIVAGGQFSFYPRSDAGTGFVVEGSYARRLFHVPTISMFAELPVTAAFNLDSALPSSISEGQYTSLFITPGLKLKFVPEFPISPFFTAGFGWARFRRDATAAAPDIVTDTTVAQFGAGVDIKIAPVVGLRFQARDYFSGELGFNNATLDRQHNLTAMGGLYFRF
jgi:hypothetical protein